MLQFCSRSDFGSLSLVGCSTTVSWCEGAPVPLKLSFKLGVGAVRQSILARIILCCVCICVMHVFVSLLELFGGIFCLSCNTAIGLGLCKSIGFHSEWSSLLLPRTTDVTSNPTPQACSEGGLTALRAIMLNMMALRTASPPSEQALGGRVRCHIRGRKTELVGVKTDGLAKSEAYGSMT